MAEPVATFPPFIGTVRDHSGRIPEGEAGLGCEGSACRRHRSRTSRRQGPRTGSREVMRGTPLGAVPSINEVGMGTGDAVLTTLDDPSQESTGCPAADSSTWVRQ
jgi:hypothetical protein